MAQRIDTGRFTGNRVRVVGAGVAGLCCAVELIGRGHAVELLERASTLGESACSWKAGGMLAPWCEGEAADEAVTRLGQEALDFWPAHVPGTVREGTLVLAPWRDGPELARFAARTGARERLDEAGVAALEPDLAGRFRSGLFFPREAHLDPRVALPALAARFEALGGVVHLGETVDPRTSADGIVVDCRGFSARADLPELRGVRGEMLVVATSEIRLSRPVRLLHPRFPLYVVPRGDGRFMLGATMIESADRGPVSARAAMDLLNAAYALHPAFAEARILEMAADVRPAYPDNLPRVTERGRVIALNGLYRHGFLLAPAFARQVGEAVSRREAAACA